MLLTSCLFDKEQKPKVQIPSEILDTREPQPLPQGRTDLTESEVADLFADYVLSYEACKSSKDRMKELILQSCPAP